MIAGLITASLSTQLFLMFVALAFLILKTDIKKYAVIICIYFIAAGIADLAGTILALNGISNILLFRVFSVVELILLAIAFLEIEKEENWMFAMAVVTIIVLLIIEWGYISYPVNIEFPVFFMLLQNLLLFAFGLRAFYFSAISKVNPAKEAQLWFSLGFSFYFAINTVALLFWQGDQIMIGTAISISNNIIKNLFMGGSFICLLKQAMPLSR